MKVDKVLARFATAPENKKELRRVARALGNELPRHRLDVLRKFRAGLAKQRVTDGSLAEGYIDGLLDVTAEYEVSLRQGADECEIQRQALRKDWREVLLVLKEGPKRPSDVAALLAKDRPTVTRILKKLRAAGLVQVYASDELDGRTRPHRLTLLGQRIVEGLDAGISADVERGISIAVALFRHLVTHASSPTTALDPIAHAFLGDPGAAAAAVSLWAAEAKDAGLVAELGDEYLLAPGNEAPVGGRNEVLWDNIPALLDQLKGRKDEEVPVLVRTHEAWGAWAYALQDHSTGRSRTIDNGDILAQTIELPPRFDLLYDDPAVIGVDRDIPTMQALMQRADEKFVITTAGDPVPEGFIQIELDPKKD